MGHPRRATVNLATVPPTAIAPSHVSSSCSTTHAISAPATGISATPMATKLTPATRRAPSTVPASEPSAYAPTAASTSALGAPATRAATCPAVATQFTTTTIVPRHW